MDDLVLVTGPVALRRPEPSDAAEFLDHVEASRDLHRGLVEPPASEVSFYAYVNRIRHPAYDGFLVRTVDSDRLVGVVNVNSIVRGSIQSASIGYYRLSDGGGRDAMSRAVARVVRHAFDDLGLHRVEANIQPSNARSIALVSSIGFTKEGYSPAFLRIGGEWRDHERWAVVAEHWILAPTTPPGARTARGSRRPARPNP